MKFLNGWLDPQDTLVDATAWKHLNGVCHMVLWRFSLDLFQHGRWSVTPHHLAGPQKNYCYARHERNIRKQGRLAGHQETAFPLLFYTAEHCSSSHSSFSKPSWARSGHQWGLLALKARLHPWVTGTAPLMQLEQQSDSFINVST